jgi:fibrillarin-like pre-rRNA processing protein
MKKKLTSIRPSKYQHVYTDGHSLFTINIVKGVRVYGETLKTQESLEYRAWNPRRSKLAAMILKRCRIFPFDNHSQVLYLGAATGTTASHISDIVVNGMIYCVEVSPRAFRELIKVCALRFNMIPILQDANYPERYRTILRGNVDIVYQDIAQKNQVSIFIKNLNHYLRKGGYGLIFVKSRSIDVTKQPRIIFRDVQRELQNNNLAIQEVVNLEPYEKDHIGIIVQT